MQNPFDQFDGPAQPQRVAPMQPPAFIPGQAKPEKPKDPPSGYNWGPNGSLVAIPGGPADKPEDGGKDEKTTADEKLSAGYYSRALRSHKGYGAGVEARGAATQAGLNMLPTFMQPVVDQNTGDTRRAAESYADEFIRAKLRKESGASIPPDEMAREYRTYFPIPGDGPSDIERKAQLRAQTIEALKVAAGRESGGVEILPVTDINGNTFSYDPATGQWTSAADAPPPVDPAYGSNPIKNQQGEWQVDNQDGVSFIYDAETKEWIPVVIGGSVREQYDNKAKDAGALDAFGEGAVDTITFGLRDELEAGAQAIGGSLRGEGSFFDLYGEHVGGIRDYQQSLQEGHGGAYLTGQIAGGLAVPFGSGASGVGGLARVGAAQGGAYGFGSSEGNAFERLPGAGFGAATGAGVGAGLGYAGNALMRFVPNRAPNAAQQEASSVVQAGERRQVPIRQYDVRPDVRQDRAVAMTSERGAPIIRQADAEDAEAMEAAVARDLGGDITPGDRLTVGDTTQQGLQRARQSKREQAQTYYGAADKLAGPTKLTPTRALQKLDEHIAELEADGPNSNREIINYLKGKREDLARDGGLSIQSLRRQRSNLRGELNSKNLDKTDAERRIGEVLSAASEDVASGLTGKARDLYLKGDQIWADRAKFTKQVANHLLGPRDNPLSPETTAARLEGWVKKDFGRARRVWAELGTEERKEIASLLASNLGRDSKGNFSISMFLNHTSGKGKQAHMSPQSMRLIFGDDGMRAIQDLRAIASAKVAGASEINSSKTGTVVQRVGRGFRTLLLGGLGFQFGGPVGAVAAPAVQSFASRMGQERMARMLTNPDFTKWLRTTPESAKPEVINRHLARLNKVASRSPVLAADAKALQQFLMEAFSETPTRAAAGQDEGNGGHPIPNK